MGKVGVKVECLKKWCKFNGSYPSLLAARNAILDHKAETRDDPAALGEHQAVIVKKDPPGTRSLTSRRRLRRG
jgi:hypothetical protein